MPFKRNNLSLPCVGDSGNLASDADTDLGQGQAALAVSVTGQLRRRVILETAQPQSKSDYCFLDFNPRASATLTMSSPSGLRMYSGRVQAITATQAMFAPTQAALRLQRRRDFRLMLARSVQIVRFQQGNRSKVSAAILDLSGGGAQIELSLGLGIGEIVEFSAPMGAEGFEEPISAVVLSCSTTRGTLQGAPERYVARLSFDDDLGRVSLSETRRDEIVRYLFRCQREQLKLRRLLAPAEGKAATQPRGISALLAKVRGAF